MVCMKCGKENVDGCRFCVSCGEKIANFEKVSPTETVIENATNASLKETNNEQHDCPNEMTAEGQEVVSAEKTKGVVERIKDVIIKLVAIACVLLLADGCLQKYQSYQAEQKVLKSMYSLAVDEIKSHLDDTICNAQFGKFDKKRVVFQEYTDKDFGYGELRYARYGVTVPCQWDSVSGHVEGDSTLSVYYYTSDQNIPEGDGKDSSVEDHLYIENKYW